MLTDDPRDRMGAYKRLVEVPEEYRLAGRAQGYRDRDLWNEWMAYSIEEVGNTSDRYRDLCDRVERRWKPHMDDAGRHHAFADPEHVETFCQTVLDRCKPLSGYQIYWTRIESFYKWLQTHADLPHVYHPPWMTVVEYPDGAAATLWDAKMGRRDV